ncbi:Carbohydrate binding domain-containing protein [Clostridium cavendishii DSM 21758]|uniref:Carbohydrate binding domain-containing protein n=1 Tax=Clostridium cavendishii DSM 21758 TaxID=1121302 RepID=A0A1M6DF89_9CLOT|nr:endo-alpha-N-acetylgalactosaminidase family protein [Clostridium cavendishii]SHI71902.1 Carbohydrate binding domain-containing protein [Clostridium cavendishii DSM 21758]
MNKSMSKKITCIVAVIMLVSQIPQYALASDITTSNVKQEYTSSVTEKTYIQNYDDYAGLTWTRLIGGGSISKDSYSKPNTFKVQGKVEGTDLKADATVSVKGEAITYNNDFETDATKGDYKITKSTGTIVVKDGNIKIPMNGVSTAVDMKCPNVKDFTYETDFTVNSDQGRIGLLFRYFSETEWGAICYDAGSWIWKNGAGQYGSFPCSFKLEKDVKYKIKVKVEDNNVELFINNESKGRTSITNLPTKAGKIGLSGWYGNKVVTLDNVKVQELAPIAPPEIKEELVSIKSDKMDVVVDKNFPRVVSYTWKEDKKVLAGEKEQLYVIEVNGEKYIPQVTATVKDNFIEYKLNIKELNMAITLKIVINDNKLRMEVTDVKENNVKLQYLNFPSQSLAAVTNREKGSIASVVTTGDWNNIIEEFKSVDETEVGAKGKTYAFLNNNDFAVTINNNTIEGGNRAVVTTENRQDEQGIYKKTGIASGTWTYREVLKDKTDLGSNLYQKELPWLELLIARDENKDNNVSWQDAAILYRENMKIPVGGEDIKNSLSYIDFNIAYTQNPFLRGLDTIKKLYNYTDKFGQLVLEKGYQAEGHDDSHPDYGGHIGIRQGGKKDFNKLIEEGKKYNAKVGVHINATEYMLDAFETPKGIVNKNAPGWGWLDQAYYVDQRADITTGELFRRLDLLKNDAPNLSWVYVDVYTGNGWNAYELASKVNSLGYGLATEMNGPLEQQVPWTHWGGDPVYPNKGNASKIMRFIKNDTHDIFLSDPLLKGNKHLLAGGWGTKHCIEGEYGIDEFYNQVLPTKYMQHFKIMTMDDNEITFENNLRAVREGKNINYYKDGRLVATTPENSINEKGVGKTNLFLPWDPVKEDEKIYHWNPLGTSSMWELPIKWSGVNKVYLYELSDLGRTFVKEVPVYNNKVKLDVKKNTPYLILKSFEKVERINNWGDGAQIKDPGFDSQSWDFWKKTSNFGDINHINVYNECIQERNGNDLIKVSGNNGADATISQDIRGLESGKTYSVSAWVKNDNNRKVTLELECDGKKVSNVITRKAKVRQGEAVKWYNDTFERMNVEFTVPKEVNKANISIKIDKGDKNSVVFVDDFRICEIQAKNNKEDYVFYEDFENADEGIGAFYLAPGLGQSNRSHLAEKDSNGRQIMSYVLDGKFSLKTNQQPEEQGEMLITEESRFKLERNKEYELGFLYSLKDASPNYSITIKSASKGELIKIPLEATGDKAGNIIKKFKTGDCNDYYLSIDKGDGFSELILDNIYVKEVENKNK